MLYQEQVNINFYHNGHKEMDNNYIYFVLSNFNVGKIQI